MKDTLALGLEEKHALVCASSSGIGKAIAEKFLVAGCKVTICGRSLDQLQHTEQEFTLRFPGNIQAIRCDLVLAAEREHLVNRARDRFGAIDILINNAGGPKPAPHDRLSDQDWLDAFALTMQSAISLTALCLSDMKASKWGRIINVSSTSVLKPLPNMMLSNSLRLGMTGWADSLVAEVSPFNILVNTLCPGWTLTDRVEAILKERSLLTGRSKQELLFDLSQTIPLKRLGRVEEIANVALFLASDMASYMTGAVIPIDGGAAKSA